MNDNGKTTNERTQRVEEFFRSHGFSNAECYQRTGYNFLLRLRIIDPSFRGMSRLQREAVIEPLIEELPDDLQSDITLVVLLSPGEEADSLANLEFEKPSPSLL